MSKVITSPVKRWPGTVTLSDPLTFPQVFAFEDANEAVQAEVNNGAKDDLSVARVSWLILPGVLSCVEAWNLKDFPAAPTVDTFPATPKLSRAYLIAWLVREITALYREAEESPNE